MRFCLLNDFHQRRCTGPPTALEKVVLSFTAGVIGMQAGFGFVVFHDATAGVCDSMHCQAMQMPWRTTC